MDDKDMRQRVLEEGATEPPFSGKYYDHYQDGTYRCGSCGALLFEAGAKFVSKEPGLMGWPSFDKAVEGSVTFREDQSAGMQRTEVICTACEAHLGHVFNANDAKTGQHFCINSAALDFKEKDL